MNKLKLSDHTIQNLNKMNPYRNSGAVVATAVEMPPACTHAGHQFIHSLNPTPLKAPQTYVCAECIKTGDTWVHLRECLECGKVHCCDSSKNKHATAHFHATHHPVARSIEPGEDWTWCYVDEVQGTLKQAT